MKLVAGLVLGSAACAAGILGLKPSGTQEIATYATSLVGRTEAQRHNALLSVTALDGAIIGPGQTFSFNKFVGTCSRDAGYRRAPVSYNGTLIASWGGGVCQTSTTLYNAALLAGLEKVERNRHRFAPSYVPPGRDAAVAYDAVDLKLRNPYDFPVLIHGRIAGDSLIVSVAGARKPLDLPEILTEVRDEQHPRVYRVGEGGNVGWVRNGGKNGYEVATYRVFKNRRELLSLDSYPVMNRIVEYR